MVVVAAIAVVSALSSMADALNAMREVIVHVIAVAGHPAGEAAQTATTRDVATDLAAAEITTDAAMTVEADVRTIDVAPVVVSRLSHVAAVMTMMIGAVLDTAGVGHLLVIATEV